MSTEFEDQIAGMLSRYAEQAPTSVSDDEAAVRLGRQFHTRRRMLTAALATVATAGAIAVGLKVLPRGKPTVDRIGPPPLQEVTVDLAKLTRGADPQIPWFANGVMHNGAARIPISLKPEETLRGFMTLDHGGFLLKIDAVLTRSSYEENLVVVDADGKRVRQLADAMGVVVSADHKRMAWRELDSPPGAIVVGNALGVEVARKSRHSEGIGLGAVAGFAGERIVLSPTLPTPAPFVVWDLGSGKVTPFTDTIRPTGTDGRDIVIGTTTDSDGHDNEGLAFYSLSARKTIWTSWYPRPQSYERPVDTEAGLVAITVGYTNREESKQASILVLETATGRPRFDIRFTEGGRPGIHDTSQWLFEPDGSLLIKAGFAEHTAMVRCSMADGHCELASGLFPVPKSSWPVPPFLPSLASEL